MEIFVIIVGVLLAIGGIALGVFVSSAEREFDGRATKGMKLLPVLLAVVGIGLFVLGFSFQIVPTGYTGVSTMFGQVSNQVVHNGFNWKVPFVQSIHLVNNKQQDATLDGDVWGETAEKTPVYASDIEITFQISGEKSAWLYTNVSDPDNLVTASLVSSAVKAAMVELEVSEVTNRAVIEPLVKEKLNVSLAEKYGEGTVVVHKVVVNNMDFEASYNEAIAAKSIAQQTYERQKIENETAVAKAEADKKVAIMNAEAEAEAALIAAEAEAEANRLLTESLTEEILKAKFYETWDGVLPKVMGSDAVVADIGSVADDLTGGQPAG